MEKELEMFKMHTNITGSLYRHYTQWVISINIINSLPPAPFQKARGPSSCRIFQKQSTRPLYVVCPARAATCNLVLMTSAGVTREAAGMPRDTTHHSGDIPYPTHGYNHYCLGIYNLLSVRVQSTYFWNDMVL